MKTWVLVTFLISFVPVYLVLMMSSESVVFRPSPPVISGEESPVLGKKTTTTKDAVDNVTSSSPSSTTIFTRANCALSGGRDWLTRMSVRLPKCQDSAERFHCISDRCKELWRPDSPEKSSPRRIQYLHMPMAGKEFTTTLRNYLPACNVKDVACPHREMSALELRCDKHLGACNGHQHFEPKAMRGIISGDEPTVIVTMLRDPVRRLVSAKQENCHRHSGGITEKELPKPCTEMSLEEFIDVTYIPNCQTKMLTRFYCAGEVKVTPDLLAEAKKNLHNLDFFGIADRWEESVQLFHCQFGAQVRPSERLGPTSPTTEEVDALSPQTIAHIRTAEEFDIELYNYAVDLFHRRKACLNCRPDCD